MPSDCSNPLPQAMQRHSGSWRSKPADGRDMSRASERQVQPTADKPAPYCAPEGEEEVKRLVSAP